MDFLRQTRNRYFRRSNTHQSEKVKELAKFIANRYSYQEGLVVTPGTSKIIVEVDEEDDKLGRDIKKLNPKLVEVRTSCRSSRANSRRPSIDKS